MHIVQALTPIPPSWNFGRGIQNTGYTPFTLSLFSLKIQAEARVDKSLFSTSWGGSSAEGKEAGASRQMICSCRVGCEKEGGMEEREIVMGKDGHNAPASGKKGQLLVVEDDKVIQKILSKNLSFMGYDVSLGLRYGSTVWPDTLKSLGIKLPELLKRPYEGPERRKDLHKRKRVEEMTPEEMREELLTDPLTGLGNHRAYQQDPRLAVQVFVDVDSLKWINDNISHEAGDEILRTVGRALGSLDWPGYCSYHISGDEFMIQAKNVQIAEAVIKHALGFLNQVTFGYTLPDGTTITKKGVGISYGIATTVELAEEALRKHKAEREAKGLRALRGEPPPGVAREEVLAVWTRLEWAGGRSDRSRRPSLAQIPRFPVNPYPWVILRSLTQPSPETDERSEGGKFPI
jgi:GGDEF domain-containing protein